MSADGKCPVHVTDHTGFHTSRCNRPIKRNGKCGIHARADDQELERRERYAREADERRIAQVRARGFISALTKAGLPGGKITYEGDVVFRADTIAAFDDSNPLADPTHGDRP